MFRDRDLMTLPEADKRALRGDAEGNVVDLGNPRQALPMCAPVRGPEQPRIVMGRARRGVEHAGVPRNTAELGALATVSGHRAPMNLLPTLAVVLGPPEPCERPVLGPAIVKDIERARLGPIRRDDLAVPRRHDELRLVRENRLLLDLDISADIDTERRINNLPQMHAVVIDQPFGIDRITGQVGFGQLCVEPGIFDDACRRAVIRVCILGVRQEHDRCLVLADDGGDLMSRFEAVLHLPVMQSE